MFYVKSITIPANTPETNKKEVGMSLTKGIIHRVSIEFPAGCAGLAHVQIFRFGHQLYPTNPNGEYSTDNFQIEFDDYYELFEAPYVLRLLGWNEDDTYDHTITVRIGVLPREVLRPERPEVLLIRKLARFFGVQ